MEHGKKSPKNYYDCHQSVYLHSISCACSASSYSDFAPYGSNFKRSRHNSSRNTWVSMFLLTFARAKADIQFLFESHTHKEYWGEFCHRRTILSHIIVRKGAIAAPCYTLTKLHAMYLFQAGKTRIYIAIIWMQVMRVLRASLFYGALHIHVQNYRRPLWSLYTSAELK